MSRAQPSPQTDSRPTVRMRQPASNTHAQRRWNRYLDIWRDEEYLEDLLICQYLSVHVSICQYMSVSICQYMSQTYLASEMADGQGLCTVGEM